MLVNSAAVVFRKYQAANDCCITSCNVFLPNFGGQKQPSGLNNQDAIVRWSSGLNTSLAVLKMSSASMLSRDITTPSRVKIEWSACHELGNDMSMMDALQAGKLELTALDLSGHVYSYSWLRRGQLSVFTCCRAAG
jgi:hypothetical protein